MGIFGVSVSGQVLVFLYAMALGGALGAVYDVFRILRVAFGGQKTVVFIEDILFSALALVATFVFVVAVNRGELRFFVLIGELAGFSVYYFTLGRVVFTFSKAIIKAAKTAIMFILKPIFKLFSIIKGRIKAKSVEKSEKIAQKAAHIFKKHLKTRKKM